MGCDIHFYTEKKGFKPPENLQAACLQKIVERLQYDASIQHQIKAQLPTDLQEQIVRYQENTCWKFIYEDAYVAHQKLSKILEEKGEFPPYETFTDCNDRDYRLFGILAGVRRRAPHVIAEERGIPEDASWPIQEVYKQWYDCSLRY
jgi:hypothetical protein